jgi:2'-5' RNA ligase
MADLENHPNNLRVSTAGASRRLFIGLWPDAPTVQALSGWAAEAHALFGGRIMRPDTLHLTLAFLGSVDAVRVEALRVAAPAWPVPTAALEIARFGRFKGPRIVWAGPSTPRLDWLDAAVEQVWERLGAFGFTPPDEVFRPHISLLRNAGPGDVSQLTVSRPIVWTPARCVVVASTPAATGSYYEVLAECPVSPGCGA